jgi:hypothetical protein
VEVPLIKADGKDDERDGEIDGHNGANSRFPNYSANVQNKTLLTKKNGTEYLNYRLTILHEFTNNSHCTYLK